MSYLSPQDFLLALGQMGFWLPLAFFWGACWGSFLNVVAWRLPKMIERAWLADIQEWFSEKSWEFPEPARKILEAPRLSLSHPGSHCPACGTPISWWRNVPIFGWIFLRGKAACCSAPISPIYPIGEAVAGALCLLAAWIFGPTLQGVIAIQLVLAFWAIALVDWESMLIPDSIVFPLLFAGLFAAGFGLWPIEIRQSLLGVAIGFGFLESLRLGSRALLGKEGMEAGDPKLFAAIGAWVGPLALLPAAILASLFGIAAYFVLLARNESQRGRPIPFGPFLAFGAIAMLFWGDDILAILGISAASR